MSVKDFNVRENIDRERDKSKSHDEHSQEPTSQLQSSKKDWDNEVKNANASGDGSFGRSDEMPDTSGDDQSGNNIY